MILFSFNAIHALRREPKSSTENPSHQQVDISLCCWKQCSSISEHFLACKFQWTWLTLYISRSFSWAFNSSRYCSSSCVLISRACIQHKRNNKTLCRVNSHASRPATPRKILSKTTNHMLVLAKEQVYGATNLSTVNDHSKTVFFNWIISIWYQPVFISKVIVLENLHIMSTKIVSILIYFNWVYNDQLKSCPLLLLASWCTAPTVQSIRCLYSWLIPNCVSFVPAENPTR